MSECYISSSALLDEGLLVAADRSAVCTVGKRYRVFTFTSWAMGDHAGIAPPGFPLPATDGGTRGRGRGGDDGAVPPLLL